MKVILTRDVPKLGGEGDVLTVANGYARNFLFPKELAITATDGNLKIVNKRKEILLKKADTIKSEAEKIQAAIEGKSITLKGKTGTNSSKLFGAITASNIADGIKTQLNTNVDKRRIVLIDPIKALGEYDIPIHLHQEVDVNLKLIIESI